MFKLTHQEKTEDAQSAFYNRVKDLGYTANDNIPVEAWQNAFSAEVYNEYRDDLHRWEIALATLNMMVDC
jgi:hypothetical protein